MPTQPTLRRTALITGGTGGLGFRAAQAVLAEPDWEVVITGRDAERVADTARRLGPRVTGLPLDLGSLREVRRFAGRLPEGLHAVVCNAGVHTISGPAVTADGFEQTFGVNHLAHFLLVRELLPRMARPGRAVFVTSGTHDPAVRTGFPAPAYDAAADLARPGTAGEDPFVAGRRSYNTSKLCNVLTAYELARRVPAEVATFHAFDPGEMPGTGIARDYGGARGLAWHHLLPLVARVPGTPMRTTKASGTALAALVTAPPPGPATGSYFSGRSETRSSAESYDPAKAADLWETSVALIAAATAAADS